MIGADVSSPGVVNIDDLRSSILSTPGEETSAPNIIHHKFMSDESIIY